MIAAAGTTLQPTGSTNKIEGGLEQREQFLSMLPEEVQRGT